MPPEPVRTCDDCGRDLTLADDYIEDFFGGVLCAACFDSARPDEEDARDD